MKEIDKIIKQYDEGLITSKEGVDKITDLFMPEIIHLLKCDKAMKEIVKNKDNEINILYILYNTFYK